MPATIEAPTQTEQVFVSKASGLRVVRVPFDREVMAGGGQRTIHDGLRYEFEDGVLRVDDELRARDRRFFEKHAARCTPDTLDDEFLSTEEWLRKRSAKTGEFAEVGYQAPDAGPELERIADLVIDGDEQGLLDLYEAENAGHARPEVLERAERALERTQERDAAAASAAQG